MSTAAHRGVIKRLAPRFDEADVDWCLVKWVEDGREHGDVDVLVCDGLGAVEAILRDEGYVYEHDADRDRRKYIGVGSYGRVEVDVHTAASWVGMQYLSCEWIVDTSRTVDVGGEPVPMPSPEADLLIWAAHDMRNNEIPAADRAYCEELLETVNLDTCRRMAARYNWLHQFDRFYANVTQYSDGDGAPTYHLPVMESAWLKYQKVARDALSGRVGLAIRELHALVRFDVVETVRRWSR